MSLPVTNLDDRNFDQLLAEAQALIPRYFSAWTDHNPSDPGIALVELFAYLMEIAIYQTNRVPDRSLENFAALVGITRQRPEQSVHQLLRLALESLQQKYRAVTQEDFIALINEEFSTNQISRTHVFLDEATEQVQVVIVPSKLINGGSTTELRQAIFTWLRSRVLITTRIRVVEPNYLSVNIKITVIRDFKSRLSSNAIQDTVTKAIQTFLKPQASGGVGQQGWEFGRSLFRSEIYQLIEALPGVDHVQQLLLNQDAIRDEVSLPSPTFLIKLDQLNVTIREA